MKSILREQRRSSIVAAAVTILLGLMLVLVPNRSIRFLCGLLGTALMVTGLIYILGWFAKRRDGFPVWFLIPGLLLAALGLWLLSRPASVIVLIQFSFAAVLLFLGVIDLQSALSLMREGWPRWWIDLALAALTLVLGGVVLFNPFGTMEALTILIGLSLVYDGISDLVLIHRLSRAFREAERRGDVIETDRLREVDRERGMPTMRAARQQLSFELRRGRSLGCAAVKLIHGYGSSGKGGRIRVEARACLARMKERGELRDVIPGEEFTIFEPRTLAAFQRCPDLRKDPDLERHNNGITVVVL